MHSDCLTKIAAETIEPETAKYQMVFGTGSDNSILSSFETLLNACYAIVEDGVGNV